MNTALEASQLTNNCPIPLWKFYFPNQEWNASSEIASKVEAWSRRLARVGFQDNVDSIVITGPQVDKGIDLSYQSLLDILGEEFARDFSESPETTISVLGAALRLLSDKHSFVSKISARIIDYPEVSMFKDLKACNIGRYLSLRGTAVRVGPVRPLVYQMAFLCLKCQQTLIIQLPDGIYRLPTKCTTYNCPGKQFSPDRTSPETICRNFQKIKIQELLSEDTTDCGRIPRTLDCELFDDLVDSVTPGENVIISGILHVLDLDENRAKNSSGYSLTMSVNSIRGSKKTNSSNEDDENTSPFTIQERKIIKNIAGSKNSFKLLVNSLCPDIFGHEIIKAGLLLALFRGRENPTARSNPHILIVGDPGLGKSQMLSSVAAVAPRSVFVGANTSTAAGLTATLHQEGGPGEYALEAGALVLADQGCCCIDEFDKLTEHRVLLDVMEQQVVNVAKAGVVCSLPARTSILAAANPIGGHYNHDKTIHQNIKLDEALLSRFDLIFVLLDRPDQEIDRYLSEQILSKISTNSNSKAQKTKNQFSNAKSLSTQMTDTSESIHSSVFLRNLTTTKTKIGSDQLISQQILRKYISYAQRFVSPRLSPEASQALKEFYLECRQSSPPDSLPITTRQLESAIRLSEARAKAELRSIVTKEDAEDVIAIMSFCMFECFKNRSTNAPRSNSNNFNGKTKSKPVVIKEFSAELVRISSRTMESNFTFDQLNQLYTALFPPGSAAINLSDLLESLNHHGHILKKPGNIYKLCIS